ncbi:hypothetical protein ABTD98_21315, partial [Acinetobacter baumannii]
FPEMSFNIAGRYYPTTGKTHAHASSDQRVGASFKGAQSETKGPAKVHGRRIAFQLFIKQHL